MLLTIVTLVYAGILVLALAAVLITVAIYLWRISAMLGDVRGALVQVASRTEPLKLHLDPLYQLTEETVDAFDDATREIEKAAGAENEADEFEEAAAAL